MLCIACVSPLPASLARPARRVRNPPVRPPGCPAAQGSSSTDYTRSVSWLNEKVVILREPFLNRIPSSRPSLVCASSLLLAYSSQSAEEWKGTFSFHARRFLARGRRVHSLMAKRRERVVSRRVRPVNAHEERMREACYAHCGDRERRLNTNRHEAGRRNGRDRAVQDYRAGHLAYDAHDSRGHPPSGGPPGRLCRWLPWGAAMYHAA